MRDEVGDFRGDGFVTSWQFSFQINDFEDITEIVFDFEDRGEIDFKALVGKDTKSDSHVNHADFATTKGERQAIASRIFKGGDAHG